MATNTIWSWQSCHTIVSFAAHKKVGVELKLTVETPTYLTGFIILMNID